MRKLLLPAVLVAGLMVLPGAQAQQEPGVVGGPPPEDLFLEVTAGANGEPVLSTDEFVLALGGYYRFNFVCPDPGLNDDTGFHFEAPGLIANAHIRVVSVGDMEIYMQGLYFHAFECDETGSIRFSFHPMRRGVYDLYVRDQSDPPQEAFGRVVVE